MRRAPSSGAHSPGRKIQEAFLTLGGQGSGPDTPVTAGRSHGSGEENPAAEGGGDEEEAAPRHRRPTRGRRGALRRRWAAGDGSLHGGTPRPAPARQAA